MLKENLERTLKAVVPPELHRRVRVRAAERDMSVAQYVTGAVERRLAIEDADNDKK